MASWDVFHGDRLELERSLSTSAIREALARGDLRDDDLVRPAGTAVAWSRLADIPQLLEPVGPVEETKPANPASVVSPPPSRVAEPAASTNGASDFELQVEEPGKMPVLPAAPTLRVPDWFELRAEPDDVAFPVIKDVRDETKVRPAGTQAPAVPPPAAWDWTDDGDHADEVEADDDDVDRNNDIARDVVDDGLEILDDDDDSAVAVPVLVREAALPGSSSSRVALPVVTARDWADSGEEGEPQEEEGFSLTRSGPTTIEELDLAPMVDVAFQLVLFFMVAAQTVLYKTLEIPKPSAEQAPSAVAQGRSRSLDELKEDYILVEIDGSGTMKIDREPVAADMAALVERLRSAREKTHRKAMLLSAEFATAHRNSVLAYDAANEIGLGIVIARPSTPAGPRPVQPAGPAGGQPPAPPAGTVPN